MEITENIRPVLIEYVATCAKIIHESFSTIVEKFDLDSADFPAHLGEGVEELLAERFCDGSEYHPFGYFHDGKQIGFVSITSKGGGIYEMNLLSVLPKFRGRGYGKELVDFCKTECVRLGGNAIEIEILHANKLLKQWYISNEFIYTGTIEDEGFLLDCLKWEA